MEEEKENEEFEDKEVDAIEISLNEDEINEWISMLENLRDNKTPVQLELDEDNELLINYDDTPVEEDSEEEGE